MSRSFESLHDVVSGILRSNTIDEALLAVVKAIGDEYQLWMVTVTVFLPGQTQVKNVATWSTNQTLFEPGTIVAVDATPFMRDAKIEILRGRPIVSQSLEELGLAGEVVRSEGGGSLIVIPLFDGEDVAAMLTLVSLSAETFDGLTIPYFTGVGRGIDEHLTRLIQEIPA